MEDAIREVEPLLIRAIPQRARPAPGARLDRPQIDLRPPVQRVADQLPAQEVRRRVDGAAREVLKGRGAEEIRRRRLGRGRHHADGGVRVEAADDRVLEGGWGPGRGARVGHFFGGVNPGGNSGCGCGCGDQSICGDFRYP